MIPGNYISLISEYLEQNGHSATSQCFMKAANSKIDTDKLELKVYFYDDFYLERCNKDIDFIEKSFLQVLGKKFKPVIEKCVKDGYSEKEFLANKENIEDIFKGKKIN